MAVDIVITNEVVGKTVLYEHRDRAGAQLTVPTYRLIAQSDTGYRHDFDVTRDTFAGLSRLVNERYAENDECPPNADITPYRGAILEHGQLGFRINLEEPSLTEEYGSSSLQGIGPTVRSYIQIHKGPGASEGCFLLAGELTTRDNFERVIRQLIVRSRDKEMHIYVHNRYQ